MPVIQILLQIPELIFLMGYLCAIHDLAYFGVSQLSTFCGIEQNETLKYHRYFCKQI